MRTLVTTPTLTIALLSIALSSITVPHATTRADDRPAAEPTVETELPAVKPAIEPRADPPVAPPRIVKPAPGPPIVQPPVQAAPRWELTVQEKPLHGEKSWGGASVPASSNGLRVRLQPEQNQFPANGPLSFRVEFENTSDAAITLNAGDHLGASPKLVMAHQKTAAQWSLEGEAEPKVAKAVTIPAGGTIAYTIVVSANGAVRPRPVPLPIQPRPLPRPLPEPPAIIEPRPVRPAEIEARPADEEPAEKVQAKRLQVRPRPGIVRPVVVGWSPVPVGKGPVRAQMFLEFQRQPEDKVWSGRLASKPVDFTIGNATAVPQPQFRGAED